MVKTKEDVEKLLNYIRDQGWTIAVIQVCTASGNSYAGRLAIDGSVHILPVPEGLTLEFKSS